jgi:hypothetical protein
MLLIHKKDDPGAIGVIGLQRIQRMRNEHKEEVYTQAPFLSTYTSFNVRMEKVPADTG